MDNELNSDDRRRVEAFVHQHPALKEELDSLLQYKLVPDTDIIFDGKEELMKVNGDTPVSMANYEEWLVLYMDNELTTAQKTVVEQFISLNSSVKEELALLQRIKLQPEEIIFSDKASLYRREEKVRFMPVRWWRVAAAAVLLLGVGITTAVIVNKKPTAGDQEIVKGIATEKKTNTENPVITPKTTNTPVNESIQADNNAQAFNQVTKQPGNTIGIKKKKKGVKNQLPVNTPLEVIKENPLVVINKQSNDLPQPLNNPNIKKNDAANTTVAGNNTPKEIIKQQSPLTNPVVTTQNSQSSDIVNTSYKNTDDANFDQSNGKKNKNRGFFRKVARTFEKRTDIDPTDDNKLLVAGLAIKLK